MIANGGVVGKQELIPFAIEPWQLARVQLSPEPVRITQLTDRIAAAVNDPGMKKPSVTAITNWLLDKGFLEKQVGPDGKNHRIPTPAGLQVGMSTQTRMGSQGEYTAVVYDLSAQRFVLDNLHAMLTEKQT